MNQQRRPRAFISCSLRREDGEFVDVIAAITGRFGFEAVGTVGKYEAAPKPIWEQMKEGIRAADCIVLVATPRYVQQDIRDRETTHRGISELLHVEVGMAVMADRPILAFVQEGTNVGAFLPAAVQYVELRGDRADLEGKWPMIVRYFENALGMIRERWRIENRADWANLGKFVLGGIGAITLIDAIFGDNNGERTNED